MTRTQSAKAVARERGIAFSAPMVLAILADTKTQTRRTLNPQPYTWELNGQKYWNASGCIGGRIAVGDEGLLELHGWTVGRRLWIRETYYQFGHWEPILGQMTRSGKRQKWQFVPNDNDGPLPTQEINAGVINRFHREALTETVMRPSPYKTHKGKDICFELITDAGRAAICAPALRARVR